MRPSDELSRFVRDALALGRPREDIAAALAAAGWSPAEVAAALDAWGDGQPPVPRPRATVSAREGFRYGLLFVALAVVAWHLAALAFAVIDMLVPDPAFPGWPGWARDSVRWSVAALAVFTPVVLWMGGRVERTAQADPGERRSPLRQSLGHIGLLVVALVLLGDLLATVYALLTGDLTLRFALKALAVAGVAVAVFAYVRALTAEAARGAGPGWALAGLAVVLAAAGLWAAGGPITARAERRDELRRSDLAEIRATLTCQADAGGLPEALGGLDPGCGAPTRLADPFTDVPYVYERLGDRRFRLCASFERPDLMAPSAWAGDLDPTTGCHEVALTDPA